MSLMVNFEILNLGDACIWNEYVIRLPTDQQDIYFTPEYLQLYEELGDGIAKCFVFYDGRNIALYPFLINSVNNLGYNLDKEYFDIQGVYGYNGFIASSNHVDFFKKFNNEFQLFCKENNIIAEFTRFHPLMKNEAFFKSDYIVIKDRNIVAIDLNTSYSEIWNNEYSSKNRNMIRKANKLGYKIQILDNPDENELDVFIKNYNYSMQAAKAEKYYFFNRDYFVNTFKYLKNHALLFNVLSIEGEVICSSIFYQFGDYLHYHLSGRNSTADNSVNNFLLDRAVIYAIDIGAKYFHLGGGRSSDVNDSLFKFKKSFSKKTSSFYIGKKIHNPQIYNLIVTQWEAKNPEKIEKYQNFTLKYRI